MDSRQPATKRRIDENSLRNQDDGINIIEEGGDGSEAKRFKQELHPLRIGTVLETIFSFLDANSIKNARGVNEQWNVEGAKMLINKCHVKIPPALHSLNASFMSNKVDEFKAFLTHKSSEMVMIPNITVQSPHDMLLWKLLGVLGLHLKSVKLDSIDDEAKLLSNLFDLLPNLNHLSFKKLGYNQSIIKVLTTEMSKAENIQNQLIISILTLKPEHEVQLEALEKFADCKNIMLTELNFDVTKLSPLIPSFKDRVVNIVKKLLSTSKNTLKTLDFQGEGYQTEIIKIIASLMSEAQENRSPLVVSQVTLDPEDYDQLEDIEEFVYCKNILLQELNFNWSKFRELIADGQIVNIMKKLLLTNQNTLQRLNLKEMGYNLEIIKTLTSLMCNATESRSSLVISQMTLEPKNVKQLKDIDKFADCKKIRIKDLKFDNKHLGFNDVQDLKTFIANIMRKLLATNQIIVDNLTMENCHLFLPLLKFPSMSLVSQINLGFVIIGESHLKGSKFSPSFRFPNQMPYLEEICIDYKSPLGFPKNANFYKNLFAKTGTSTSVNVFKSVGGYWDFDVRPLFKTFPFIDELHLDLHGISGRMFHSLWKQGKNLKKLHINIEWTRFLTDDDLDSIFTGFTPQTVKMLKDHPNLPPFLLQQLRGLRTNPSILNLKGLEELTIHLNGRSRNWPEKMLVVTAKHIFNRLSMHAKIDIHVEGFLFGFGHDAKRTSLEEVSKYDSVNIFCD